ncbi:galactose mutarotase [Octadecabacter sp.]|nr:galactose mutarotase [Octadecabacter sp.]
MIPIGTTKGGDDVHAIKLAAHGLSVTILTLGAILQDVRLDGIDHGLTVGSDKLADYEGSMKYHGCVAAPVVNRLQNATAVIDGRTHQFEANLNDRHTLHSGAGGAQFHVWTVTESAPDHLTLSHDMPHGRGGFPGNRTIKAQFEIHSGPVLRLTLTTTTDRPSIANATNHSYWNLDGAADFGGHQLQITAPSYLPTDDVDMLVTGEVCDVARTAYDFRKMKVLTAGSPPLDTTFCVASRRWELTECLTLSGRNGVTMKVATTEAGMHVYDGRDTGYSGLAIEAQGWPDAPNNAGFPSIQITPDAPAIQITEWRF